MAPWASQASFVAQGDGTIDTSRDAPTAGTYAGIDPDGVFWSMNTARFEYATSADVAFAVTAADSSEVVSRNLVRPTKVDGVRTLAVNDPTIVGKLFVPPGAGKRPAILAFGGSEGGQSGGQLYASEFLPLGYVVLAVAYFADNGLPAELREIPLEYFDHALAWLAAQPDVDASRMAVAGGSRGGELSLLLASLHPELKAAIADAPSSYLWGAVDGIGAAWTVAGKPLPYISASGGTGTTVLTPQGDPATAFTPTVDAALSQTTPADLEAARSKVEHAGAAIAMFGGADDQLWPSCKLAQVAMDKLTASGHTKTHADELTCFEGAGHLVDSVGLPTTWDAFAPDPIGQETLALGGTPAGAAHAGRERQKRVRAFLTRAFGP
jgi:poly(3-hydroxybutyrate) depolymerase